MISMTEFKINPLILLLELPEVHSVSEFTRSFHLLLQVSRISDL